MPSYNIPATSLDVEEVIKNSQFITRIRHVDTAEAAKAFIKEMNLSYPEANHHCWAYIVGNPQSTTLISCSDDGEPSGTAGKPMLHVLQHSGIGDIAAVRTRFFGGTKLGTGGLARAYGGGVKLALDTLKLQTKISYNKLKFAIDYSQIKDCEHLLKDFITRDLTIDYQENVLVSVEIELEEFERCKQALINHFKGNIEWNTI